MSWRVPPPGHDHLVPAASASRWLSEGLGGDDGGVAGQSVLLATLYYGGLLGLLAALVAWLVLPAAVCAQAASSAVLAPGPASAMDANGAAPAFGA